MERPYPDEQNIWKAVSELKRCALYSRVPVYYACALHTICAVICLTTHLMWVVDEWMQSKTQTENIKSQLLRNANIKFITHCVQCIVYLMSSETSRRKDEISFHFFRKVKRKSWNTELLWCLHVRRLTWCVAYPVQQHPNKIHNS